MNKDFRKKLVEIQAKLPEVIRRLPGVAKVEGLNFIHDNFEKQGFEEKKGAVKKWKPRKPKKNDRRPGRQLLVDRGALRRSWETDSTASTTAAVFSSALPYAEAHNDGLQSGRPPGFTMPERKMIGDSDALFGRIETKLDKMVEGVMK